MERLEGPGEAPEEELEFLRFGCLRTFRCGASSVNSLLFFGDADHLLAGASDKTIYLLGAQHGVLHEYKGKQLAAAAAAAAARCCCSGRLLLQLRSSRGPPAAAAGRCCGSAAAECPLLLRLRSSRVPPAAAASCSKLLLHCFCFAVGEHTGVVACVGAHDELTHLFLSGGLDRRGILWDVTTGLALRQFPRTAPINACLLRGSPSPLSHLAALGDSDGLVRLFDIRGGGRRFGYVQVLSDAKDAISSIVAARERLIVASLDGCVYTYDLRKGALHVDCYGSPITCMSLSAEETLLLLSCVDASLRLAEVTSGETLHAFWGHLHSSCGAFRMQSCFFAAALPLPPPGAAAGLFAAAAAAAPDPDSPLQLHLQQQQQQQQQPKRAFDELLEALQNSKFKSKGNSLQPLFPYVVSGSEDGCIYFWDVLAAARGGPPGGPPEGPPGGPPDSWGPPGGPQGAPRFLGALQEGVHGKAHEAPALVVKSDLLSQRLCTAATDGTVKLWRQL
ncbi:hypothetical protein, conserved [Eimeria tenella]|uniref:WD domain, G-beta repeat-containing protein n=1 Tax=Eimeria tenella TaxID=5802 RepID=U6KP38_EIMTE|nr:hypothetical protein, conserved [Eimeria tenella]CDJ39741.1 hypothetical protein, conserved [Eimeria tenella]|eukprot:XP_013230494.1 hypothetical protein, conserved [Eimeria tenella]